MSLKNILLYIEICLFRKGPEDIPYAGRQLQFAALYYTMVGFFAVYSNTDVINAVLQIGTEVMIILGFSWILLNFFGKPERYYQTSSAFFGVDASITLCALPLMRMSFTPENAAVPMLFLLLMMFWHWLITGFIISRALSRSFWFGLLLAFCYIAVSFRIITSLFPAVEAVA